MVKYSVIIPVYNAEKTIVRCLESLVCQDREDIQIVAVNDGSSDSSEKILLEFAAKYPVIEYVKQENSGVSHARNAGLDHAKGTYVTFVDSDDFVAENYFSVLDQAEDCDLLVFANENVGGPLLDETKLFAALQENKTFSGRLNLLLSSRKVMPPWNKRFKRNIIEEHSLRFIEGMQIGEDFNFCLAYAMWCRGIEIVSQKIILIDVSGENSLSRKYRQNLDDQMAAVFENAVGTITNGALDETQKNDLLTITDYLFVKNTFSSIAEEMKCRKMNYIRDRQEIADICKKFSHPIAEGRCGMIHTLLRFALNWKLYYLFYFVSYWAKGRKYNSR